MHFNLVEMRGISVIVILSILFSIVLATFFLTEYLTSRCRKKSALVYSLSPSSIQGRCGGENGLACLGFVRTVLKGLYYYYSLF